jgi:hypothetical protein
MRGFMLKMVAESDLVRLVMPHYRRTDDDGRTLIQTALADAGDIEVRADDVCIHLEPLNSPHRTRALAALCDQVNQTKTTFPGSPLRLHFDVKPLPPPSLAFPGGRAERAQPDIPGFGTYACSTRGINGRDPVLARHLRLHVPRVVDAAERQGSDVGAQLSCSCSGGATTTVRPSRSLAPLVPVLLVADQEPTRLVVFAKVVYRSSWARISLRILGSSA